MVNAFKCPHCDNFVRHVRITSREALAINAQNEGLNSAGITLFHLVGTLTDITGITKAVGSLIGYEYYKCTHCGLVTQRNSTGEIKDVMGHGN